MTGDNGVGQKKPVAGMFVLRLDPEPANEPGRGTVHRTGGYGAQHKLKLAANEQKGAAKVEYMFARLRVAVCAHALKRVDDGRYYEISARIEVTVVTHPDSAHVGEYVSRDLVLDLCEPTDTDGQPSAVLVPGEGTEVRRFAPDENMQGLWLRMA